MPEGMRFLALTKEIAIMKTFLILFTIFAILVLTSAPAAANRAALA